MHRVLCITNEYKICFERYQNISKIFKILLSNSENIFENQRVPLWFFKHHSELCYQCTDKHLPWQLSVWVKLFTLLRATVLQTTEQHQTIYFARLNKDLIFETTHRKPNLSAVCLFKTQSYINRINILLT